MTFRTGRGGVLVTGASKGIGEATSRLLVGQGFRVIAGYRRDADAHGLEEMGAIPVSLDVADPTSISSARDFVRDRLRGEPLVGLVNNAGIPGAGPLELLDIDEVRRVLEVNVLGALAVTQAFLEPLRAAKGKVIMISSLAGRIAAPFRGPYAASKFALEAISDSLRRELAPFGTDVVVIQPGPIATAIWDVVERVDVSRWAESPYGEALPRSQSDALREGRAGLPPERVAKAVARALTATRCPSRIVVARPGLKLKLALAERLPPRWLDRLMSSRRRRE